MCIYIYVYIYIFFIDDCVNLCVLPMFPVTHLPLVQNLFVAAIFLAGFLRAMPSMSFCGKLLTNAVAFGSSAPKYSWYVVVMWPPVVSTAGCVFIVILLLVMKCQLILKTPLFF